MSFAGDSHVLQHFEGVRIVMELFYLCICMFVKYCKYVAFILR